MLLIGFAASLFSSAALLFVVEPMLAKMLLPRLGGTPAVWNTCLVFFQVTLLAGYVYAHAGIKWLTRRVQIAVHVGVICLPLLPLGLLPLHLPAGSEPPSVSSPVPWVLATLSVAVGLPFLALASSAPVLQRWFADTGRKDASDPYFLYAASNAGSLVGLFAYPAFFEPLLHLGRQNQWWSYGYDVFAAMTLGCAAVAWRYGGARPAATSADHDAPSEGQWKERLHWIALAFVPSSLMLGVTTAITTDVSAMPLFWVLPLAVYLVSFVLVFARRPLIAHDWLIRRLPFLILIGLLPVTTRMKLPLAVLLVLYLTLLFGVAMVCHGELARSRPRIGRLTEFYLLMSVGGACGGAFNSLLAPVLFHSVIEFPLVLIFAALLRPPIDVKPLAGAAAVRAARQDWLLPLALGVCMATIILGLARAGVTIGYMPTVLIFGYSMLWCLSFGKRPLRFAAGITALLIASSFYSGSFGSILDTERSYFGVYRVTNDPTGRFRYLISGGTLHGVQSLDPARAGEPLAYYTRGGPAGQIARAVEARAAGGHWAVVGLGAGAMACLTSPDDTLTYYEIDPLVARIAEDARDFTFLKTCDPAAAIVLGDARLKLRDARDSDYALIVLDAFSGDSIPVHLMTKEALALYKRKLAPGGLIAFHISNLYMQFAPTLGSLSQDANLASLMEDDPVTSQAQADSGKSSSRWVVMARTLADLDGVVSDSSSSARWLPVPIRSGATVWTDDYSNLLGVMKWDGFVSGSLATSPLP